MKINAAVTREIKTPYIIEEVELAPPKAGEVLVKIAASGMCHTDEMILNGEMRSPFLPIVLGHEGSGIVTEVGPGVRGFKAGDRVCLSISYCGECPSCLSARPYACEESGRLNFGGRAYDNTTRLSKDGVELASFFGQSSFATYSVVHENNLVLVPDGIDLALTAPLGCGIQTGAGTVLNFLKPAPGSSIVVSGCGAVGMSALMAAKICGCSTIIAVDVVDSRLQTALELGATHVVNAREVNTVEAVMEITKGRGVSHAADCSGRSETTRATLNCTGYFGVCAVVGAGQELTINVGGELSGRHRILAGITEGHSRPKQFIPQLMDFIMEGRFPLDKIVKYYDFEDINTAREDSRTGGTLKPILLMK